MNPDNSLAGKSYRIKRFWVLLLFAALSGTLSSVSAAEPAPPTDAAGAPAQPYYRKPPVWVEPTHSCKSESIHAATPTADFIDNADGTVTHKRTGLVWMRCSLGQNWDGKTCVGKAKEHSWKFSLQAATNFNAAGGYAGHADWRLPNIKELDSIVETQCIWPSINTDIFPATPSSRFWSSTLSSLHSGDAWFIRFDDGYLDDGRTWAVSEGDENQDVDGGRFSYPVRLVRGGQPLDSFNAKPPVQPHGKKK